jgi:hypothetical protein
VHRHAVLKEHACHSTTFCPDKKWASPLNTGGTHFIFSGKTAGLVSNSECFSFLVPADAL